VYYWRIDKWLAPGPEASTHFSFLYTFSIAVSDGLTKYYGPILIAGYIAVYYVRLRKEEVRAANLCSELAQSQLRALKMQLQPHFLFNTLHSISTLVYTDAKRADRMIIQLSDLLRTTLDERDFVSLREEIEYVQKYLGIEEMRFSDRLTVHFDIAFETLEWTVPFLILQPLVENAVKHGISKKVHRGMICVAAFADGDWLRLKVVDNGPGLASTDQGVSARQGVGLKNTRDRLKRVYQEEFQFLIRSDRGSGTVVEISIPRRIPSEGSGSSEDSFCAWS
jgi:sensor histidine kinase YesM